jgi:hypothetical protein
MNREFEFHQLLRAYRSGILSEAAFDDEMKHLENGHASRNGGGEFKAFGRSYASERDAVLRFLETVSPAETAGGDAIRAWLSVCTTECIRGGLKMVAERESYHGRVFARRLEELGGKCAATSEQSRKNIEYLSNPKVSDMEKLHRGATRFPNPDETIRPLFEFAALLKEDLETKEMVQLFAQDELSTLKWQNGLCAALTEHQKRANGAAATA